jgi:HAD superfamily hydrolase (TIGR01509 family)
MPRQYDALIFDCDGVLINSEQICQETERAFLAGCGIDYAKHEYVEKYMGTTEREFRALLHADALARFAVDLPPTFFDDLSAAISVAYRERLAVIPDAATAVGSWSKPKAVASSSEIHNLLFKLRTTGLAAPFGEHIYSADAVGVGKPNPAIFVYTAAQLGVAPERCLVVEDSVNGVVAAKRAGMTAIGFVGGLHCLPDHAERLQAHGADVVVRTHAELTAHLRTL